MSSWLTHVMVVPTGTVSAPGVKVKLPITTCWLLIGIGAVAAAGSEARAIAGAAVALLAWPAVPAGAAVLIGPHAPSSSAASSAPAMAGRVGSERNSILQLLYIQLNCCQQTRLHPTAEYSQYSCTCRKGNKMA